MNKNGKRTLFLLLIGTLAIGAVFGEVIVDGALTHEISVEPGGTFGGTIVLRNSNTEAEEVKLYQTDYRSTADGYSHYDDPGTLKRSNAEWIAISSMRFTIPAGESHTIRYTVDVPQDSSLEGTYNSVLMIEPIPKSSGESASFDPNQTGVGISTVLRYAVRMITTIQDTGTIMPQIVHTELVQEGEAFRLNLDVLNAGTLFVRVSSWAELYTQDGELVGKFEGRRTSIFPDSAKRFNIDLEGVSKDTYIALVVLDCGNNDVFGANFTLQIE